MKAVWEEIPEETSNTYEYTVNSFPIKIPVNETYNYQKVLDNFIPDTVTLKKNDKVIVHLSAKSDIAITGLSGMLVAAGDEWNVLSNYDNFNGADNTNNFAANTDFDTTITFTIEKDASVAGGKLGIYYDLSVNDSATLYAKGTDLSALDDSLEILIENRDFTVTSSATFTDWAGPNGSYDATIGIDNWSETYKCDDYESITVEYEKFDDWALAYLVINSGESDNPNGTGWKDKMEGSYSGVITMDLTGDGFDGKQFTYIGFKGYFENPETEYTVRIKKVYLTKKAE